MPQTVSVAMISLLTLGEVEKSSFLSLGVGEPCQLKQDIKISSEL